MNNKPNNRRPALPKARGRPSAKRSGQSQKRDSIASAPVAFASSSKSRKAQMSMTAKGCRVAHRELVATINGSTAFTAAKYVCNPGIAATFRWLSIQAAQWERYRFHRLRFILKTRTATGTTGSVILAPDYDPTDSSPASEQLVSTYDDSVEGPVWLPEMSCNLQPGEMHPGGKPKFVRSAAVGSETLKEYDAANFYVCTVEEVGADAIGKLWVEYDVEFSVPQSAPTGDPVPRYTSSFRDNVEQTLTSGVAEPLLFSDLVEDPLGIGAAVVGVFTPPRGSYRLDAGCSFRDTFAETNTLQLEVFKNGAAQVPPVIMIDSRTSVANGATEMSICTVVNCDGTDTFQVQVTATGAAGTLSVRANSQFLVVSPA